MPDNMVIWLRDQLDAQQRWNEGTGIAAWLTYLDLESRLLYTRLASATELQPEHWTLNGEDAPEGWAHVNVVHDERAVRVDLAQR